MLQSAFATGIQSAKILVVSKDHVERERFLSPHHGLFTGLSGRFPCIHNFRVVIQIHIEIVNTIESLDIFDFTAVATMLGLPEVGSTVVFQFVSCFV